MSTQPLRASWLDDFAATSEMGALVAAYDWSSTSLGPPDSWPTELRVAVRTCLSTSFPMLVVWGDDLVKIYNDGYRPILGDVKHPGALGAPVRDVWPEIWHVIGPMFEEVLRTRRSTWDEDQLLVIERNGFPEDCYFTWSYSPLLDDEGRARGVVDIVTETTASVVATRRLMCLAELSSALLAPGTVSQLCARAVRALGNWPDCVRAADLFLRSEDQLVPVASTTGAVGRDRGPDGDAPGDPAADGRRVVLAIGGEREDSMGVLVAKLNPGRPFDAGYREFLGLVVQLIGASLDGAVQHAGEVEEYRSVSDVLQQAMLEPANTFSTVALRYVPAVGKLSIGGDWYDAIELPGDRRALVVGDCVGHGLAAAAAMSQLRAASRAMLLQGLGPSQMLTELGRYSTSVDGARCATAVCMIIDRRAGTLTYSRAGHLPPVLVADGVARLLDEVVGAPLGIFPDREYPESTLDTTGGELVVMCSDGLVERRGEVLDVGLERLRAAVEAANDRSVEEVADLLLETLLPGPPDDDVAIVVKRIPS